MKITLVVLSLFCFTISFAQKKELKQADKLISLSNFNEAKPILTELESKSSLTLNKEDQIKLYNLKGIAFLGNNKGSLQDFKTALEAFDKVVSLEKSIKKFKYTGDALSKTSQIRALIENKGNDALNEARFSEAAPIYEYLYSLNPKDTIFLYSQAASLLNMKDYDQSLVKFKELLKIGYTGKGKIYSATNVSTGQEQIIADKNSLDQLVKKGTYKDAKESDAPSKVGEITKYIAFIYQLKGDFTKAEEAFAIAKRENPGDKTVTDAEASLYFSQGVVYSKANDKANALLSYKKALSVNPMHPEANLNIAVIINEKDQPLVDKINTLSNSRADSVIYEKLQAERNDNYREVVPYLENYLETYPDNADVSGILLSIYTSLKDPKAAALKAKLGR